MRILNKILIALIMIGLCSSVFINIQRHQLEVANHTVEMVLDYDDVLDLALNEGVEVATLMSQLKQAGISSVAVYETTLEKLARYGKLTVLQGATLINQYRLGGLTDPLLRQLADSGKLQPNQVYVIGPSNQTMREVTEDLQRRLGPGRVTVLSQGNTTVLALQGNFEKLIKWNLGLLTDEMQLVAAQGLYVIPRPSNYTKVKAEDVQAVFDRLQAVPQISTIIFSGEEILGDPTQLPLTVRNMQARNMTLGLIEHPTQLQFYPQNGMLPVSQSLQYQVARLYVIPKDEQPKLKLSEAVQRWVMADRERNIRINLLRPFWKPDIGKDVLETNLNYIAATSAGLREAGFSIGKAGTFPPFYPNRLLISLIILGTVAAGLLLLSYLYCLPRRWQIIILLVATLPLAVAVISGGGTSARVLTALAAANIFPPLAMAWQIRKWSKVQEVDPSLLRLLVRGTVGVVLTACLAIVGGLYVGALLADVRFLLEMQIFRGVKLTFVMPLLLTALVYLKLFNLFDPVASSRGIYQQIRRLLHQPVVVGALVLFAVGVVVLYVFIGRSGHTAGVPVPDIELKLRAFLDYIVYARPREKEFMIGHPLFLLSIVALYRRWPRWMHFLLVIGASIAQGSLVETFAHLRTPVLMSFVRGIDGLVFGIVLGVIYVLVIELLRRLWVMLERRLQAHE